MSKVAILVDGGFYQKRANYLFGPKTPKERADELITYCHRHLDKHSHDELYRIFYYDCMPLNKQVYHPLIKKTVYLGKSSQYVWMTTFFNEIVSKRKIAFRKGELLESSAGYTLRPEVVKKLCAGTLSVSDLKEEDFFLSVNQKGVDMRIGLDISSIAYKKQADKIVLIAGDSDFVPAAKHARREGIDFILDPMWQPIKDSLNEHIDGLQTCTNKEDRTKDSLYKGNK